MLFTYFHFGYLRCLHASSGGEAIIKKAWWEVNEINSEGEPFGGSPAWVVVQIFVWLGREGRTMYWVANKLNELGIKAPEGGIWTPARLSHIIRNRCYTGNHAYNVNARVPNPDRPLGDITAEVRRTLLRPKPKEEGVLSRYQHW